MILKFSFDSLKSLKNMQEHLDIIYNIFHIILHKKFFEINSNERQILEHELNYITDENISKRIEEILQNKNLQKSSIFSFFKSKFTNRPIKIQRNNIEIKLSKHYNQFRNPRLDFYISDEKKLYPNVQILKSLYIELSDIHQLPHYFVDNKILKVLLNETSKLDIVYFIIFSQCSDSLFLPYSIFIDNFDILKENKSLFRYISVYFPEEAISEFQKSRHLRKKFEG